MILPLVSICIPVYYSIYLSETLESLNKQNYKNIEVILVNDGDESDYTAIISLFPSLTIKYFQQKNNGAGAARNFAYNNCNGQYIKFLDGDDLINEDHLNSQIELTQKMPEAIISAKWGRFYNNELNSLEIEEESIYKDYKGIDWILESWQKGTNMTQPGIFLIPRVIIERHGLWNEGLSKGPCDDLEFFTRLIVNTKIIFCDKAILSYRSGNVASLSGTKTEDSFFYYFKTLKLASAYVLERRNDISSRRACATQFKILAFKAYPYTKHVSRMAFEEVGLLGGSNYKFPAGGITKILNTFIGWKNTLSFKKALGFTKFN